MKKIKGLLYCTKAKPYLYKEITQWATNPISYGLYTRTMGINNYLNGTIPCECEIEVEEITPSTWNAETERRILKESCLKEHQLFDYIIKGDENESQNPFYALHIKNLHIFDKPKELSNYHISYFNKEFNMMREKHIEKAPQNMCRAFDIKDAYILISIKPEWLCKILNGEKTIEVRKKVLNCMKGNK